MYKSLSYSSLIEKTKDIEPIVFENGTFGSSDFYQGEILFVIDSKMTGNIRIIGDIDNGKKDRAYYNVIIAKNGKILSEG